MSTALIDSLEKHEIRDGMRVIWDALSKWMTALPCARMFDHVDAVARALLLRLFDNARCNVMGVCVNGHEYFLGAKMEMSCQRTIFFMRCLGPSVAFPLTCCGLLFGRGAQLGRGGIRPGSVAGMRSL